MDRDTALDRLAAVPLEEFVAERKRLAKELRTAGDREAAAEVAKLPKPTPPAWALNHMAREEPEAVGAWLEAAEALRDASTRAGEVGGAALRAAMAAHREATRALMAALRERRPLSEPMLDRVRTLLQAATVDPEEAERLRSGRLVEGGEGEEPAPAPARAQRSSAARSKPEPEPEPPADDEAARRAEQAAAEARAELERRAGAASAELERRREEAAEAEAAAAAADERLDEARRTLHRSESEAAAARGAADDAQAAVEEAEGEVRALIAQLRGAS